METIDTLERAGKALHEVIGTGGAHRAVYQAEPWAVILAMVLLLAGIIYVRCELKKKENER